MAGIAFSLRDYTDEGSLSGILKGYTYSAFIFMGPWLITTAALSLMAVFDVGKMRFGYAMIMYVFCFSLIYVGSLQFVVSRFLADNLYEGETERHIPTFLGAALVTLAPQALIGGAFLYHTPVSPGLKLIVFSLYLVINATWILMVFLGIVRAYLWIFRSFLIGGSVCLGSAILLDRLCPSTGILAGFLAGQTITLALLVWVLMTEFPWKGTIDFSFLSYFRLYPSLACFGTIYYLSTWIDKFILWSTPLGVPVIEKCVYSAPSYELPAFISQLTVVPALSIFFLRVETGFYESYRAFFKSILTRNCYARIDSSRIDLLDRIKSGFYTIVKVQMTVTLISLLLGQEFFNPFLMNDEEIAIFRVLLPGAFFQALLFSILVLMLYFEFYTQAFISCIIFLITNASLTFMCCRIHHLTPGLGYSVSAFAAFMYSAYVFRGVMRRLPEYVFMKQIRTTAGPQKISVYPGQ